MALEMPAMFGLPGGAEWLVIGLVGLLLFGRRLPEIARSVGKSIVEFKKGMRDVKGEFDVTDISEPKILPNAGERSAKKPQADAPVGQPHTPVEEPANGKTD